MNSIFIFSNGEMRLSQVKGEIGDFFAEIGEVIGEGRFDQGEPGSDGG